MGKKTLAKYWKILQLEKIYWEDTGQLLGRYWEDIGKILGRYWEDGSYWHAKHKKNYTQRVGLFTPIWVVQTHSLRRGR